MKIFFDMDGVLVDFAQAAAKSISEEYEKRDSRSKDIRRMINFDGDGVEFPISCEYLERLTAIKDAKGERTKWQKLVGRAIFAVAKGEKWFTNLPTLPGHQKMIEHAQQLVGVENVYICTSPVIDTDGGCERGKRAWVASNTTIPADQVYVTSDKPSVLVDFPDETCVLIDDRSKYIKTWKAAGGLTIHHRAPADMKRVSDTIDQLETIVKSNQ